ncbi:MAG: hypothetical protein M3400_13400 [Actinomycetota bacterium]|nr:hypothetical protein [Actinomycetota bacterium]
MGEPVPGEYGFTGGSGDYGTFAPRCPMAPDFRPLTFERHVEMASRLSDGAAHAAAEMWGNAATLFEATRDNLVTYGDSLRQQWRSQAAEPFFTQVGGTLYSLRLWADAARRNEAALHRLGDAIQRAQDQMSALYEGFASRVEEIDKNEFGGRWMGDEDERDMRDLVEEKTAQSRAILETLAREFTETTPAVEGKFAGPADARPPTAEQMARAMGGGPSGGAPQAPGGGAGAPAAPPAAPTMQTQAHMTPLGSQFLGPPPAAPQIPTAPGAGRGPAPMAPVIPAAPGAASPRGAPPAAPAIGAPGSMSGPARGAPPAAPAIGSAGAPSSGLAGRGAPPAAPSMGSGAAPGATSGLRGAPMSPGRPPTSSAPSGLQGRNAPASPMMPPGGRGAAARPQVAGRGASPGFPGMGAPGSRGVGGRPSGPGMPGAPGLQGRQAPRTAPGQPGGMAPPGSGVPRPLQGRGNPEGTRAGRSTNGRAPIRPGSPGSTGTQGLRGRSGPVRAARSETAQTTRAALRRGLDGRGMATGRTGPASAAAAGPTGRQASPAPANRPEEKKAAVSQMVGDEKLFAVDPAAPAVIERKQEKVHAKRPGPALGRG